MPPRPSTTLAPRPGRACAHVLDRRRRPRRARLLTALAFALPPPQTRTPFTMERTQEEINALKAKRAFKKFTWQGIELEQLLEITHAELATMCRARIRRRFQRGLKRKPMALIKKLRTAKANMTNPMGKPEAVKVRDSPAAADRRRRLASLLRAPACEHDGGARERGRRTRTRPRSRWLPSPPLRRKHQKQPIKTNPGTMGMMT